MQIGCIFQIFEKFEFSKIFEKIAFFDHICWYKLKISKTISNEIVFGDFRGALDCLRITQLSSNKVVQIVRETYWLDKHVSKLYKRPAGIPCEPTSSEGKKVVKVTILLQKTRFRPKTHRAALKLPATTPRGCAALRWHLNASANTFSSSLDQFRPILRNFEFWPYLLI